MRKYNVYDLRSLQSLNACQNSYLTVLGLGSLFSSVPANGNQVQEEVAGLYFY